MPSVLILDTDNYLAGIYARRFEQGGWDVTVANAVKEADALLAKAPVQAVIIDVQTIEGALKWISHLKKKHPHPIVIALTELGNREAIAAARAAGADSYLLKGHFVPKEVREKIETLIEEAEQK